MTDLVLAGDAPATAAELAARIPVPRRLPERYDGEPLRHLSPSSYSLWVGCPEAWRRRYIKGEKPPPSGAMFLGSRVDDAVSAYHRRILEHGDRLAVDQVLDIYREQWAVELGAEQDKQGINWEEELSERTAFELGRQSIELAMTELIPHLGDPVDVQRRLEFTTSRTRGQLRGVLARLALAASQIAASYDRYGPDQPWGFADPKGWKCSPRYCSHWASCPAGAGL